VDVLHRYLAIKVTLGDVPIIHSNQKLQKMGEIRTHKSEVLTGRHTWSSGLFGVYLLVEVNIVETYFNSSSGGQKKEKKKWRKAKATDLPDLNLNQTKQL